MARRYAYTFRSDADWLRWVSAAGPDGQNGISDQIDNVCESPERLGYNAARRDAHLLKLASTELGIRAKGGM